jgi:hypothetical protein
VLRAEAAGVLFVMEEDVSADPVEVGVLGAQGVMAPAEQLADGGQQSRWAIRHGGPPFAPDADVHRLLGLGLGRRLRTGFFAALAPSFTHHTANPAPRLRQAPGG